MTAALVIGADAPALSSTDEGLALARDLFGDGSEAYFAAQAALVEDVTARFYRSPRSEWLTLSDGFSVVNPVLGGHVRRHVCDRLTRLAFEPLGAWLEEQWPWLFVDARPDGDDAFAWEAA